VAEPIGVLTSCGMLRLRGDLRSLLRKTFAALCIRAGVIFGCSILVDFIGFDGLVGSDEFLELAVVTGEAVVGLIDDNFVYTDDICVLLRGGDGFIVIVGICFASSFGALSGSC
jgi:hypothetical protein